MLSAIFQRLFDAPVPPEAPLFHWREKTPQTIMVPLHHVENILAAFHASNVGNHQNHQVLSNLARLFSHQRNQGQIKLSETIPSGRSRTGLFGAHQSTEIIFTPTQTNRAKGPNTFDCKKMERGSSGSDSHADPPKTILFKKEPSGINYRIPALIYINDAQTFLAFAEKRTSSHDHDATLLYMRRGTRQNGSIQWSPVQELSTACLPGHRTMNPCPVYEKESKTLFLFFICVLGNTSENHQIRTGKNKAQLCYITSSDYGQNWSRATDLTESVIGHEIVNWATFAVGPGHGIQMNSGRLIIPAYVYYISRNGDDCPTCTTSQSFAFYSDDRGTTWQFGDRVSTESNECVMAEIIDQESKSHLYCNARSTKGCRVESLSKNSGGDFGTPRFPQKLIECGHGCQGSVVSITVPEDQKNLTSEAKNWLLYSHPANRMQRRDLGVYLNKSPLGVSEWSKPRIIHHGPSGYSDLTLCEEPDRFACLMECGKKSELEQIALVEFSLCDLLNNK